MQVSDSKIKLLTEKFYVGRLSTPRMDRKFTVTELAKYCSSVSLLPGRIDKEILIGVNGKIYDVSYGGSHIYQPGGSYGIFAGKDATRALAKMSFEKADLESRDISDLSEQDLESLIQWDTLFSSKYPVVGTIVE